MSEPVRMVRRGNTALLTLHRPDKANAYDAFVLDAFAQALDAVTDDSTLRALVVCGAGRHFCAGADLDELSARGPGDAFRLRSATLFDRLAALPVPTIAAVHGAALGGGLELALACDLRLAAHDAFFGLPETRLGLLPAAGAIARLPRAVGDARAREMIFTGRRIDASTALRYGLVQAVTEDSVCDAALALAEEICAADPLAVRLAKRALETPVAAYPAAAQAILYQRRASARA